MRTPKTLFVVIILQIFLLAVVNTTPSSRSDHARIVALVSHTIQPYQEVLEGFQQHLRRNGVTMTCDVNSLQDDHGKALSVIQEVKRGEVSLLLTLGSLATRAAAGEVTTTPIVAGMILDAEDLKGAANATGVILEFPLETQFEWMRRLLPSSHDIGVIYSTAENGEKMEAAIRLAEQMGLRLHPEKIHSPKGLPAALESVARKASVLWGVADKVVLTPQTAQHILLFSYRNRIPFIGLSSSWVKAGALYSLEWDYGDMGVQCAEIALRILKGTEARSIPPVSPRKVEYSVNLRTAQEMKIEIPGDIVRGAREVF